jgi:hypothetical protein
LARAALGVALAAVLEISEWVDTLTVAADLSQGATALAGDAFLVSTTYGRTVAAMLRIALCVEAAASAVREG